MLLRGAPLAQVPRRIATRIIERHDLAPDVREKLRVAVRDVSGEQARVAALVQQFGLEQLKPGGS